MKRPLKYVIGLLGCLLLLPGLMRLFRIWKKTSLMIPSDKYYLVLKYLLENGFSLPVSKMIAAQFAHETANFSSELFEKYNNPCGMKVATKRDNKQSGSIKGFASYKSLADGVADYALWWQAANMPFLRFSSLERFVKALKDKGYFEDSFENYYKGVKNFYELYVS